MKHLIFLILISLSLTSCLKDAEGYKKDKLFLFFDKMKIALEKEDKNWFKRNAVKDFEYSKLFIESIPLKSFFDYNTGEYSATINYNIGASDTRTGAFIIRNSALSPIYYYMRLSYNNKKSKWVLESVDKLPTVN